MPKLRHPSNGAPTTRALALLAAALFAPVTGLACHKAEATAAPDKGAAKAPTKVTTHTATAAKVAEETTVTGTIVADREAMVAADALGKVLSIEVQRGATVKKGDVLARLDTRAAVFSAEMARAQAKVADSQAALAKTECERSDALFASGAISAAEHDRAAAQCRTTNAQVQVAAASAAMASKTLGDGVIRAPFAGVIGERFVQVGEYVNPPSKVVSLYSVDPLRIELAVPERLSASMKPGAKIPFATTALGDRSFEAEVRYVSPILRRDTRDLVVEAIVANADGQLKPGMFATARIAGGEVSAAVVPRGAIRGAAPNGTVFVVTNKVAEEHVVRFRAADGGLAYVLDGLPAGAVVVAAPPETLRDGDPLEL